jgi:hypothetical protein
MSFQGHCYHSPEVERKSTELLFLTKTAAPVLPDAKSGLVTKLNW